MVICSDGSADLHMAQPMPPPLTVSCFSKIQIGFTFLVPAHPGSPGKRTVKRVCVCVCVLKMMSFLGLILFVFDIFKNLYVTVFSVVCDSVITVIILII